MPTTTNTGPTLTNMTFIGRQTVKYGLVLVVSLMVGRTLLNAFTAFWRATHPPKPAAPTLGFGILPAIEFPQQEDKDKPQSYELETKTGNFPKFVEKAEVYFMPGFNSTLFDDETARELAASLGFVFEPKELDSQNYRFTKSKPLASTLDLNIRSKTFELKTDYLSKQELLLSSDVPDTQSAIEQVKNTLLEAGISHFDVLEDASASAQAVYLKAVGNRLQAATSVSDAEFVQIDLKRAAINGLEVYTPAGKEGTIHAVVTGAFDGKNSIMRLRHKHYPMEYSQEESYPLRSVSAAWNLLQSGEAYVVNKGELDKAVIRHIYLGYFDSFEYQEYFQPIYVFEGDKGFLAYVSAIDPRYIQTENF
ncbi:MAG: hypothetical protein ABFQ62_04735 [Patescibacteria group bacterium]